MTKKDYVKLAAVLQKMRPKFTDAPNHDRWEAWRRELMSTLASDNPRFDRDRFIQATEA